MKNSKNLKLGLNKLTIARIDRKAQSSINGGDCIPTDPTWFQHGSNSDAICPYRIG